ncbi:rhomboid family intramembrane serine protease [Thalassovita mediterranea]|uniref:Rhomboid family protein n=1 Tax=Thalassovita mediterranea TaxID=340021 RepID=A0A0P1GL74_9RHOB|nr:rhomboid family intramembrane serine protease [Thalassovita mediterranea]MCG7573467.1 rhomboid family intramembrane serine protease [Phaeobacter sp. CNT1-3]CUH82991.1 Rhomboid family protein [Thalassovita mediterranea]SIS31285.1 Rhomboid family protein [Thalassovita mediterranea]
MSDQNMQEDNNPVNPLPPVIVALFLFILGIEVVFNLGARGIIGGPEAVGWRLAALQKYAFSDEIFEWMRSSGQWPFEHVMRFVTYGFVHLSFTQALFGCVIFLALGKMAGEVYNQFALLLFFVLGTANGALVYALVLDSQTPLVGAYPGAYAMIGAYTYLMWLRLGMLGEQQVRAFSLIGFLLGIQLLFGLLFGSTPDWLADVGGFVTGLVLAVFLIPGSLGRLLARLRQR